MARFTVETAQADPVRPYLEGVAKSLVDRLYGDKGPAWGGAPLCYTCLEGCSIVFGGNPTDYACSTAQGNINNQAQSTTYGVGGCKVVAEDSKVGVTYKPGSTSSYCQDNCIGAGGTNYCFK